MASTPNLFIAGPPQCVPTSLANTALDASGDKVAAIFFAPKAGNISAIGFAQTRTGTSPVYDARLEGITSGVPNGSLFAANANVTFSDATGANTWYKKNFTSAAAVVEGDRLAAVIAYSSGTINGSNCIFVQRAATNGAGATQQILPRAAQDTSGSYSASLLPPCIALYYSDGTIIEGGFPCYDITGINFVGTSSPDERGTAFTAQFSGKLSGFVAYLTLAASATATVTLYNQSGDTLDSIALTTSDIPAATGGRIQLPWSSEISVTAGQLYRITVKATSANNVTMQTLGWHSTVERNAGVGAISGTSRADADSFTDTPLVTHHVYPVWSQVTTGGGGSPNLSGGIIQ